MKKFYICLLAIVLMVQSNAFAYDLLYRNEESTQLAAGLTQRHIRLLTAEGWIYADVVTADVADGAFAIEPLIARGGVSVLADVKSLAADSGAVAAINADFFNYGTAGRGSPIGLLMKGGEVLSSGSKVDGTAAFLQLNDGTPQIDYITTDIVVTAPNGKSTTIKHFNKYDPLDNIIIYNNKFTDASRNTLDTANLCEMIIEDGIVTDIREGAAPVPLADGMFVIAFLKDHNMFMYDNFKVGDSIKLEFKPSDILANIDKAVGGGTMLVTEGIPAKITHGDKIRNPRTAIGYNQDRTKIILATVDGRGKSMGMTLTELTYFMISMGAYDAINLDGGGSTTMVAKNASGQLAVVNTPSDGSLRKVTNGIGVTPRNIENVSVKFVGDSYDLFANTGLKLHAALYDGALNPLPFADGEIVYTVEEGYAQGEIIDGYFIPREQGTALVTATHTPSGASASAYLNIFGEVAAVIFPQSKIPLPDEYSFQLKGKDAEGNVAEIDHKFVNFSVDNAEIAKVDGNKIYKLKEGKTYMSAAVGGIVSHAAISGSYDFLGIELPQNVYGADRFRRAPNEPHYSISLYGSLSVPEESQEAFSAATVAHLQSSNATLNIATTSIPKQTTALLSETEAQLFVPQSFGKQPIDEADAMLIWLDNTKGGLRDTDPKQWKLLNNTLYDMQQQNLVVLLKADPFGGGFTDTGERDAFFSLLTQSAYKAGRNITVISPGKVSGAGRLSGIRYFTVQGATGLAADKAISGAAFTHLKLYFDADGICFNFE